MKFAKKIQIFSLPLLPKNYTFLNTDTMTKH